MLVLALVVLSLQLVSDPNVVSAQSPEYVRIESIDLPPSALPNQRVLVHVVVSYSFWNDAEIGLSISDRAASQLFAASRGGIVHHSKQIFVPILPTRGTRDLYMAIIMPTDSGSLQLTLHAFYSHGQGWIGSDNKGFSIIVTNTQGHTLASNRFAGGYTPGYASAQINSVSIGSDGKTWTLSLSLNGTTEDAGKNGMIYLIRIDTSHQGGSVQDANDTYEILIFSGGRAILQTPRGQLLKELNLSVKTNAYEVSGLSIEDIGATHEFNIAVVVVQALEKTMTTCTPSGIGYGVTWIVQGVEPPELGSCYTTPTGDIVYQYVGSSPAGGWMPVSIPIEITISTPVPVAIDGVNSQPSNGTVNSLVPSAIHVISAPDIVQIDNMTRLRLERWADGQTQTSRTENLQEDASFGAIYVKQYLLSLQSSLGVASGGGWYDEGSSAQFSISSSQPMTGFQGIMGAKWAFQGWYEAQRLVSLPSTGSISMNEGHDLNAHWTADYTIPAAIAVVAILAAAIVVFATRRQSTSRKVKRDRLGRTVKHSGRRS